MNVHGQEERELNDPTLEYQSQLKEGEQNEEGGGKWVIFRSI